LRNRLKFRQVTTRSGIKRLVGGFALGLAFGLAFGLMYSGGSWVRYHVSVLVLAAYHHGPVRFGEFLDWACDAELLRTSGDSDQVRHRQLQDWLTSQDTRRADSASDSSQGSRQP
jgi:hypothetical protein